MGRPPETLKRETGAAADARKGAMLAWVEAIAPFGIVTTDAELRINGWNQWLANHSGLSAEAVMGRLLTEVFPELHERGLDAHFRRALAGEISVLSTALHRHLLPLPTTLRETEGETMLQTARIAPLRYEERIVGTIATVEDVTQRETQAFILRRQQEHDRLLSSSLSRLLSSEHPTDAAAEIFPTLAAPLKLEFYSNYLLGPEGTELRLHAASGVTPEARKKMAVIKLGENLCGLVALQREPRLVSRLRESDLPEARFAQHLGLRAWAGFPLIVRDRLLGTLAFGSYERDTIAADELNVLAQVARNLALAIDRDRRERALSQARQSLAEHAGNLEAKVAERTAKLHETIVQLESFSYTVAHDLRAPIRSLKSFSDILLKEYAGAIPETGQDLLRRIHRASNKLDALTRDLLQFSRIARENVNLAPVDVTELVREIVSITPALQHGTLTIAGSLGRAWAQPTLLQQCFSNLFDNALKFAGAGKAPHIVVRAEWLGEKPAVEHPPSGAPFNPPTSGVPATRPPSTARLRVWVEDNGIGIAAHSHQKIFGIFERVSGLDHIEGTGIGLAIVARAMRQMGGSCGVDSELGRGSRFWLEFASA